MFFLLVQAALVKTCCEKPGLVQVCKFLSTPPSKDLLSMQVILEKIKQRDAYTMLRLTSVRSKQEEARELSEDMLGASLVGGHTNGKAGRLMGLGDLMGPGEWGPGTVRKMVAGILFFPTGSQSPLALSLPLGSRPVSWGSGSVALVVALLVSVLLEAPLMSEARSEALVTSAGPSPWDGVL